MSGPSHEGLRDLLGVHAVDAIDDPAERELIEAHVDGCAACRAELDGHLEVLALLGPEAAVDDRSWASLAAALAPVAASPPAEPRAREAAGRPFPRRRRALAWLAPVAAAAAAAAITLAVTHDGGGLGTPVRDAAMTPMGSSTSVAGTVALYRPDRPDGVVVVDLRNLPDAPAGHHYEVWVLRPGTGEEMEPIGAFTPHDGAARLELRLPGPGEYVAVDVSIQADGGPPEHSGDSVARAVLS